MMQNLVISLITLKLFTFLLVVRCQPSWDRDDSFLSQNGYTKSCNETVCSTPCDGAAPPPYCPEEMPTCPSKCACMADCENSRIICFMTKHCLEIRRFFTKPRRVSAKVN